MSSFKLKCLVLGAYHIDTRALLEPYIKQAFSKSYKYIIGCDIATVDVRLDEDLVTLALWDIASIERFRVLRTCIYHGASCAILIFDLTRMNSFNPTIFTFISEIYASCGPIPLVLIGCNADQTAARQISRETIDQFCEQLPYVTYFEINSATDLFPALESAAESALNARGLTAEIRRQANEFQRKIFQNFLNVLTELGIKINDNNEVEILTHRGLFSINIFSGRVVFESIQCVNCGRMDCMYKHQPRKKTLCIVANGMGWSDTGLADNQLLCLAKIYAIKEDLLPQHVLNQMSEILNCRDYIDTADFFSLYPTSDLPEKELSSDSEPTNYNNSNPPTPHNSIPPYPSGFSPSLARILLRNHQLQFFEGRLPYSVYKILKERLERIAISG